MTALPPQVSWEPGAAGAFTRQLRLGEWIGAPVTPLFATWLLPAIEDRMHALFQEMIGQRAPRPYHVIVNGWYFYSINFLSGAALLRSLPGIISHAVREPRAVAGVFPATVRHSFPIMERAWRSDVQPRYRALVAEEEARVETLPIEALPGLVDELGRCRRRVLHLDRGPGRGGVQDGDEPGPLLPGSSQADPGRQPPAAGRRHRASGRARQPRGQLARLVVRTSSAADRGRAADYGSRLAGAAAGGCRGGRRGRPGIVTSPAPQVQAAAGRQPAPRPDPRGADGRADAALAGHAARRGSESVRPWPSTALWPIRTTSSS